MHVLPFPYVLRVKNDEQKVRIIAKIFRQVHGVNYNETHASIVTLATVFVFLSVVSSLDLDCNQMDVTTAFLNGDME